MKTEIEKSLEPAITLFTKMIAGKSQDEIKVITYDFIEELWVALATQKIMEGIEKLKQKRNENKNNKI